jgi:hypothetical protein
VRSCRFCSTPLAETARFCPECGTRVDPGESEAPEAPTQESAVPSVTADARSEAWPEPQSAPLGEPRLFGVAPPLTVLALAAAALALAVLLAALGRWAGALAVAAAALALFAYFLSLAQRRPESPVARTSVDAIGGMRARVGAALDAYGAVSAARRRLLGLRREHEELRGHRERAVRALGEAVYRGDDEATEAARADLTGADEALRAKEVEMTSIVSQLQERVHTARNEVRRTELLEPEPALLEPVPDIPEPAPPPDEGTPPVPAPVPEPYPPPDEADIPSPDPGEPGSKS